MNIFILSLCPYLCAIYHCDKHVVKMILETAQMLCVTHYLCSNNPSENLLQQQDQIVKFINILEEEINNNNNNNNNNFLN